MTTVVEMIGELANGVLTPESGFTFLTSMEDHLRLANATSISEMNLIKEALLDVLLPVVREKCPDKNFSDFVARASGLIADYAIDQSLSLDRSIELKNLGLRMFAGSPAAKVRVAGLEILQQLFSPATNLSKNEKAAAEALDIEAIMTKHLFGMLGKTARASGTLTQAVNRTLGCLCETFPSKLLSHSESIVHMLISQLEEQTSSKTSKLDLTVVQGCFEGLNGYLQAFELKSKETKTILYDNLVKVCVRPEKSQGGRRLAMRAGLELFAKHCAIFSDYLLKESDARHWFETLRDWSFSFNSLDHKIGFKCLDAFLRVIGQAFKNTVKTETPNPRHNATFTFLMKTFTNILKSKNSTSKEATLAVKGYSHLAAACRIHLGPEQVSVMLLELVQKTEEVFLTGPAPTSAYDNQVVHLPSYVESLANVMDEVEPPVEPAVLISVQRIVVHLIKQFPKLPFQYHPFAIGAFHKFFEVVNCKGLFLASSETVVDEIIYQGVVQTCSHPVVSDTDDLTSFEAEKVVSTKSYFSFWDAVLSRKTIYDSFLGALVQVLEKLDLSTQIVSSVVGTESEPDIMNDSVLDESQMQTSISKTASSSATNDTKSTANSELQRPTKVKDFTVLANLVELATNCLPKCDKNWFETWHFRLAFSVMTKATRHPNVGGLYSILSLSLNIIGDEHFKIGKTDDFQVNEKDFKVVKRVQEVAIIMRYLEEVVFQCCQFQQDLLRSSLELILDLPLVFVSSLLPNLSGPLKKVFSVGQPVKLVEKGIDALTNWYAKIDHYQMNNVVGEVLVCLKHFMSESCSEMLEESAHLAEAGTSKIQKRRKTADSTVRVDEESDYERVQKKILLFFGGLDTNLYHFLLPDLDELGHLATALDSERHLRFLVPFSDAKPSIYLDDLLSRIVYLCLNAKHRKTRVAACECLHVTTVFLVGKSATQEAYYQGPNSLAHIYRLVFPTILKLAGDEDRVIKDLFEPLLIQTIHWFTRPGKYERDETMCLLDAIFEGMCEEQHSSLRDVSANYFREFFAWSIKQMPKDLPVRALNHPRSALKRLEGMWVHSDPARRHAASLAFNQIYKLFREEKELVEHFTLELVVHAIHSLALCDSDLGHTLYMKAITETKSSLDHLQRILSEKSAVFCSANPKRSKPKELCGSTLNSLIDWLINWTSRPETEARHKSMELIYQLIQNADLKLLFDKYLAVTHGGKVEFYLNFVLSCNFPEKKGISLYPVPASKTYVSLYEWILWLTSSVECFTWLLETGLVSFATISDQGQELLTAHEFFVSKLFEKSVSKQEETFCKIWCKDEVWTPRQALEITEKTCTLLIRIFNFIIACIEHAGESNSGLIQKICHKSFWSCVYLSLLAPTCLGFDVRKEEVRSGLKMTVSRLIRCFQGHSSVQNLLPTQSFGSLLPDHLQTSLVLESVWQKSDLIFFVAYVQGLRTIHLLGLAKVDQILPTPLTFLERLRTLSSNSVQPLQKEALSELLDAVLSLTSSPSENVVVDILSLDLASSFESSLFCHISKHPRPVLSKMMENLSQSSRQILFTLVKIAKFFFNENCKAASSSLVSIVSRNWSSISMFSESSKENLLFTIHLLKHLFLLDKQSSLENVSIFEWVIRQLSSKHNSLKMKNRVLELLPPYLESEIADDSGNRSAFILNALKKMSELNFPLCSKEFMLGSSQYSDYTTTFGKLASCFEDTASIAILEFLIEISAREEDHVSQEQIRWALMSVMSGKKVAANLDHTNKLLNTPFSMFRDSIRYPCQVRTRIVTNFLLPMLDGAKYSRILENFFADHIDFILGALLLPSTGGTDNERINKLATKSGALKLLARLYGNAPNKDLVHSPGSKVTLKAFEFLAPRGESKQGESFTGREMSVFLVKRLQGVRADVIDGSDELQEAFRVSQCEAFNTFMSVISRLQNLEKFYVLIFKEDASKAEYIWSRIINSKTEMRFPLEMENVVSRRTKVVSIRQSSSLVLNTPGPNTGRYLSSHYLGDSSLSQDITSFDFHESLSTLSSSQHRDSADNDDLNSSLKSVAGATTLKENVAGVRANEVLIEVDPLNDHECMAHLMRLIEFMRDEKIYSTENVLKLPGWMEQIRLKLVDDRSHQNIKLFLLRLILNCNDIFRPFAKHFGKDILGLLTSTSTWPGNEVVNYFSLDLIVMLLSWSEVYTPSGSLGERNCASALLDQLAESASHPRREIVRYILHVVRFMVEVWKPCLNISYGTVYKLFARTDTPSNSLAETSVVGIQLMGILLANGLPPYQLTTMVSEEKFFLDLSRNLDFRQKQVYQPTAEVLGMVLSFYESKDPSKKQSDEEINRFEKVIEIVKNQLISLRNTSISNGDAVSRQKFFDCLYNVFKHHSKIVVHFANGFIYNLKKAQLKGEALNQCLEMLQGSLDYLEENIREGSEWRKELGMIGFQDFLVAQNAKQQLLALTFLEKVVPRLADAGCFDMILDFCDVIGMLSHHNDVRCREKALAIMRWIFDKFRPPFTYTKNRDVLEQLVNQSRICLIKGFSDEDSKVVSQLVSFFNSPDKLTDTKASERVVQMFRDLLNPDDKAFLFIFPDLLLSLTEKSPDFLAKIYENPLADCVFNEMNIDTSWRTQHASVNTPMWVETLSSLTSQSQTEQKNVPANFLRATQALLTFAPTQDPNNDGPGKQTTSLIVVESILSQQSAASSSRVNYKQTNPDFGLNSLSKSGPKRDSFMARGDSIVRVGKRFFKTSQDDETDAKETNYASHEKSKVYFARAHQQKTTREEEIMKERRGRRQAQVNLMRTYRTGELPDIQISHADVIRPLRNLCYRDEIFARVLTVELVSSLAKESGGTSAASLKKSLIKTVNYDEVTDRTLAATILESLLPLFESEPQDDEEQLKVSQLVSMCRSLELEQLGILVLETLCSSRKEDEDQQPRKRARLEGPAGVLKKTMSRECVMGTIDLYKSMGDLKSARELYLQEMADEAVAVKALTHEMLENYELAKQSYQELCESSQQNLFSEGYLNCLEKLCEWKTVSDFSDELLGDDVVASLTEDSWKGSFLLSHFVSSKLHIMAEGQEDLDSAKSILFKAVDAIRKSNNEMKKVFEKKFGLELALLYIFQSKPNDAQFWSDQSLTDCLADWSVQNEFSIIGRKRALGFIKRLNQLRQFLKNKDSPEPLPSFSSVKISKQDDLSSWIDFLSDRSLYLKFLAKTGCNQDDLSALKIDNFLLLSDEALSRKNYPVAIKLLTVFNKDLQKMEDKRDLERKFNRTYYKTSALKSEIDKTTGPDYRFNVLYGFLMKLEASHSEDDQEVKAEYLHVLSKLVKQLSIPDNIPIMEWMSQNIFKKSKEARKVRHLATLVNGAQTKEEMRFALDNLAIQALNQAATHSELPTSICWTPDQRFSLATFNYDLWNNFLSHRSLQLSLAIVKTHLDSLKLGSKKALKLFPNLLTLLEEISNDPDYSQALDMFTSKSADINPWFFVPWINQILSMFGGCRNQIASSLGPLLVRVAEKYAESLRFPFQFTLEHIKKSGVEPRPFVRELELKLKSFKLLDQILSGMSNLCLPEIKATDFLGSIDKTLTSPFLNQDEKIRTIRQNAEKFKEEFEANSTESQGGAVHSSFFQKFQSELGKVLKLAIACEDVEALNKAAKKLKIDIARPENRPKRISQLLKEYSPFLHSFHMSNYFESVEMFGQYGGEIDSEPDPTRHVKISSFGEIVTSFHSIRRPVKIKIVGDNGRCYEWIVKYGEDMRQDQRIQQVFGIANNILCESQESFVPIRTYKVVPISSRLGVIQFLPNTTTYKSLAAKQTDLKKLKSQISSAEEFKKSLTNKAFASQFRSFVDQDLNGSLDLKQSFQKMSSSPEGFFFLRNNFLSSHGTSSIVSWIMSIGDRHADNLLISKVSGESIPIDFGHAFGSAFFLPVPELVPFRLTPQIQSLMWPFRLHGPLRAAMIHTLKTLSEHKEVLMAALSVFIKEPTLDWLDLAKKNAEIQKVRALTNLKEYPRKKIEIVRRKLTGGHPCQIMLDELRHGNAHLNKVATEVNVLVWGPPGGRRYQTLAKLDTKSEVDDSDEEMEVDDQYEDEDGCKSSFEEQVDCLLELATDYELLARAYIGWSPWM